MGKWLETQQVDSWNSAFHWPDIPGLIPPATKLETLCHVTIAIYFRVSAGCLKIFLASVPLSPPKTISRNILEIILLFPRWDMLYSSLEGRDPFSFHEFPGKEF